MMESFSGENLQSIYSKMLLTLEDRGQAAAPRGKQVIEFITPAAWFIHKPWEWPLFIPARKLNPFFALAEVVWMWSGKGGGDFITFYNKSIEQFLDPGIPYFHGSYGRRVRHAGYEEANHRPSLPALRSASFGGVGTPVEIDQLEHVIQKLRRDPETRQAVVSLWDPAKDNLVTDARDYPCNNLIYFTLRQGHLNMSIIRRSNDLVWGVPYNMCQFGHLQALIAGSLGAEIGTYTVYANNLHMYQDLYPKEKDIVINWAARVAESRRAHQKVYEGMYDLTDMRWALSSFDNFIQTFWESFEKRLRMEAAEFKRMKEASPEQDISGTVGAYYMTRAQELENVFNTVHIPDYWKNVFKVLLAYHARKAKATGAFWNIVSELPTALQWLITDFVGESNPNVTH